MDETMASSTERSESRVTGAVRRVIRVVGWTSIVVGVLILGFVAQQLFVTTWFAQQQQTALTEDVQEHFVTAEITEVEYVPPSPVGPPEESTVDSDGTVTPDAGGTGTDRGDELDPLPRTVFVESTADKGSAFAIIRIPTIDRLKGGWAIVEGVELRYLKNGAGHMSRTPLPGLPGNSVISGHRTTYGAPFHEIGDLVPGDVIEIDTALGTHTYAVRETIIVGPTELWVTEPRDGAWLTLTTCHPKFSSRQRLIVFAELVDGPNWEAIYA
ncbi:MAG: sortase [Actinomycetota bacterium]|nr:sortase [Actinomycetota bacterium]